MSEYKFKMPRLGESITEAAIIKWFKNVGDTIDQDEVLLEVATDKVDSEVPSLVSGIVTELLFKQNDVISIGETIAIIKTDGVALPTEKEEAHKQNPVKEANKATNKSSQKIKQGVFNVSNSNLFFSPLIISIAKEQHISFEELARIPLTGDEGRLRKSDLMSYIDRR